MEIFWAELNAHVRFVLLYMSLIAMISDKRDFARYRTTRHDIIRRASTWSKIVRPLREDSVVHVYHKSSGPLGIEYGRTRSLEYMKRKYNILEDTDIPEPAPRCDALPSRIRHEPTLSVEEAEKISTEIIQSFSKNRDMKELLEGAKFFAGASALAGGPGERRARRKTSFYSS